MAYRDPAHEAEQHYSELDRKAVDGTYFLQIEDILTEPILFEGTLFDVKADFAFVRVGEKGAIEINYGHFSNDIYVQLPGLSDIVKLDHSNYTKAHKAHWERLQKFIEAIALTKAKLSQDWEMEEV